MADSLKTAADQTARLEKAAQKVVGRRETRRSMLQMLGGTVAAAVGMPVAKELFVGHGNLTSSALTGMSWPFAPGPFRVEIVAGPTARGRTSLRAGPMQASSGHLLELSEPVENLYTGSAGEAATGRLLSWARGLLMRVGISGRERLILGESPLRAIRPDTGQLRVLEGPGSMNDENRRVLAVTAAGEAMTPHQGRVERSLTASQQAVLWKPWYPEVASAQELQDLRQRGLLARASGDYFVTAEGKRAREGHHG